MPSYELAARRVLQRADELAAFTEEPGRITRPLLTPAMTDAKAQVREWMRAAGLETREDALGNLAGRRGEPGLVIGSHLDSVADAGRYDGVLGILVGLAIAEALPEAPLEVVAFADEDGLRFQSIYLGSRAFVGELTPQELDLRDAERRDAARGRSARSPARRCTRPGTRAYFEVHIEQGPVLESEGLALGVVTAIAGQSRFNLVFQGHAGHAGTTPMHLRRDAAAAAAEFVLAAERIALRRARARRDGRRAERPARRGQRDPGPRRRHARPPPPGRRGARGGPDARCAPRPRRSPSAAACP